MRQERRFLFIDIIDGHIVPKRRDFIVAVGKKGVGAKYQVLTSRKVNRRDPLAPPRYSMAVRRVDSVTVTRSERIIEFNWYPRTKKKLTFEQYMRRQLPPKIIMRLRAQNCYPPPSWLDLLNKYQSNKSNAARDAG